MKLILELLFTSTHSLPIFTSGQYLLHSKLHLEGLHYTSRFLPLHYLLAINDSNTRTCGGHRRHGQNRGDETGKRCAR